MNNAQKKLSLSKRHIRRIIANQTSIDIAGCCKQPLKDIHIINTNNEDSCDSDISEINKENHIFNINNIVDTGNEILFSNNATNYEHCETNFLQNNNDRVCDLDNVITDNIDNKSNNEKEFESALTTWAVSYNIPHNACNALLKILQKYTSYKCPSQMRTLLRTPQQTVISKVCEGEYFHWSLDNIIKKMLLKYNENAIDLLINIDGLPLGKSSNTSLWLILCSNTKDNAVYLIGAYFGREKPQDSNIFLQRLVNDLIRLINQGFRKDDKIIKISLFGLICDAPAKSFVLYIKGHNKFYSCTKCTIIGKYIHNRICFSNTTLPCSLRTDKLFAVNGYKNFQTGF